MGRDTEIHTFDHLGFIVSFSFTANLVNTKNTKRGAFSHPDTSEATMQYSLTNHWC